MSYYGNYPSNSGPPPPGGGYGGGYGGYGQSAYNVNQYPSYGGGGGGYGGYSGGGYSAGGGSYACSGAVPGFTTPAVQQCQTNYGYQGGQAPPPMQQPQSMQYNQMQNMMSNVGMQQMQWQQFQQMGLVDADSEEEEDEREFRRKRRRRKKGRRRRRRSDDDYDDEEEEEEEDEEEKKRRAEEKQAKYEQKIKELQEKLEGNDDLKEQLRANFITELLRRQAFNGTFEPTQGTVFPFEKYYAEDPVTQWFQSEKDTDINDEDWDALYDAEYMRFGMKGLGTNEQVLIDVVSTRSNGQRNRIMKDYKTAYGRDLIEDLKGELSGDFEETMLACFETPARYDAWSVKKAIYGLGTDETTLIEILMTRTNAQIQEMVQEYNQITYGKQRDPESSIEDDIDGDTSGDFKRLLISGSTGNRRLIAENKLEKCVEAVMNGETWTGMFQVNYKELVNGKRCKNMAKELFEAGEDKWGTDEETFNRIMSTQDMYTLRAVWDEYVKLTQRDIMNSVDRETSGNFKKGLLAIAQTMKCRPMFFAEKLYKSMKGLGTDDSTLIRIVISRAEIDMQEIKVCFLEKYHQTLWKFINDDTSGDYRKLLCGIVGRD